MKKTHTCSQKSIIQLISYHDTTEEIYGKVRKFFRNPNADPYQLLHHPNWMVRKSAITTIRELNRFDLLEKICQMLQNETNLSVIYEGLLLIKQADNLTGKKCLELLLKHPSQTVRKVAGIYLGKKEKKFPPNYKRERKIKKGGKEDGKKN